MKKSRYKQHLIEGEYYSIRQLTLKLGINHHRIKAKIEQGATTFKDLKMKVKKQKPKSVNYNNSMYADKYGYWKLLAKALRC